MKVLAIDAWARVFEPVTAKQSSVTLPTKRGTGMAKLLAMPGGMAAYGCWASLMPIATTCMPRGTLTWADHEGQHPHDAKSLAMVTGWPEEQLRLAIELLLHVGWLVWEETETYQAPSVKVSLLDLLTEVGVPPQRRNESMLVEWRAAFKDLRPTAIRDIFKNAKPGITYPSEFKKRRQEAGV